MTEENNERRIKGIAKQIGILKKDIIKTKRISIIMFLLGLILGTIISFIIAYLGGELL